MTPQLRVQTPFTGPAALVGATLLLLVGCGGTETTEPDDSAGSGGAASGSGGAADSAGGTSGGENGTGATGSGGLGAQQSCDGTAEDYCAAYAEWAACDGAAPDAYDQCMEQNAPFVGRYDACVIAAWVGCFEGCAPDADTACTSSAALQARPDLFDVEQQEACAATAWNSGGGGPEPTSCIERHLGWARECADFARSCDASYNLCPTAALMRPDLLVLADACLEDCDGLGACLNAVIEGE